MELKNINPNGYNVEINNVLLIYKYLKLNKIKDFKVYFR